MVGEEELHCLWFIFYHFVLVFIGLPTGGLFSDCLSSGFVDATVKFSSSYFYFIMTVDFLVHFLNNNNNNLTFWFKGHNVLIAGHQLFPHSLYLERLPLIHPTALKTYQSMLWPMANLFWYDFNSYNLFSFLFFFWPSALILLLCCHKQMLVCENLMYFFLIHLKPLSLSPARNSGCQ